MKKCTRCNIEKEIIEFGKDKLNKDGLKCICKDCIKKYNKEYAVKYNLNNKEKISERNKKFYINNSQKLKQKVKEYHLNNKDKRKEYIKNNKDLINKRANEYFKNKKITNPLFKLSCNIRNLILISIKGNGYTKKSKTNEYLGCSFEEFKIHLEKQFTNGMSWENQGKWHMDHIVPVSYAKSEEDIIKLNHYTNFQPMWAIDNIRKSNKILEKQLVLL